MPTKTKDGRWKVDERPDGGYGRRVRKLFTLKDEAERYEAFIKTQATQKKPWNPKATDRRSFADLIALWFKLFGASLKDGAGRLRALQAMDAEMGHPRALEVDERAFARYRARRLAAPLEIRDAPQKGRGRLRDRAVSINTVNHELAYAKAVFNKLRSVKEWAGENPLTELKRLDFDEPEMAWLDVPQIRTLLEACALSDNVSLLPVVRLCLGTGARWSEAEGLQLRQIREGQVTYTKTKTLRSRTVPFKDPIIEEWIRGRKGQLFTSCYSAFRTALEGAGIELPKGQLTHVLRHSFASHYMKNGGDILTLQRVLGHRSLKTTMRYAHFSPSHLADVPKRSPLAKLAGHFLDKPRKRRS